MSLVVAALAWVKVVDGLPSIFITSCSAAELVKVEMLIGEHDLHPLGVQFEPKLVGALLLPGFGEQLAVGDNEVGKGLVVFLLEGRQILFCLEIFISLSKVGIKFALHLI